MAFSDTSFLYDNVTGVNSFTITQPFLGAPLEFSPALGTRELEELVDAYVLNFAPWNEKLSDVTIDFYKYASVDLSTGALVRTYNLFPVPYATSPTLDFALPSFTPSPSSDYSSSFTSQTPPATTPKVRSSRVAKKPAKATKATSTARLPGFSIMTRDGVDVTTSAGRGTKTKEQREHAHLMRIMKACDACKRKKVRCDPAHRRADVDFPATAIPTVAGSISSSSSSSPSTTGPYAPFLGQSPQSSQSSQFSTPSFGPSNSMDDFVLFPNTPSVGSNPPSPPVPLSRGPRQQTDISNVWVSPRAQASNLQDISSHLLNNPQLPIQPISPVSLANVQRGEQVLNVSPQSSAGELRRNAPYDGSISPTSDVQRIESSDTLPRLTRGQRTRSGQKPTHTTRLEALERRPSGIDTVTTIPINGGQEIEHSDSSVRPSGRLTMQSDDRSMRHQQVSSTSPTTVHDGELTRDSDVSTNSSRSQRLMSRVTRTQVHGDVHGGDRPQMEIPTTPSSLLSDGQITDLSGTTMNVTRSHRVDPGTASAHQSRQQASVLPEPVRRRTEQHGGRLERNEQVDLVGNLMDSSSRGHGKDSTETYLPLLTDQMTEELRSRLQGQRLQPTNRARLSKRELAAKTDSLTPLGGESDGLNLSSTYPTGETGQALRSVMISVSLSMQQLSIRHRSSALNDTDSLAGVPTRSLFNILLKFAKAWALNAQDPVLQSTDYQASKAKITMAVRNSMTKSKDFGTKPTIKKSNRGPAQLAAAEPFRSLFSSCWKTFSSNIRPLVC